MIIISSISFEVIDLINLHSGKVNGILFSNFDEQISTCSTDGTICVYQISKKKQSEIYKGA